MKDIARELDVSVPLVSKVLNNKLGSTRASKKTIEAIQKAARRMGYKPNRAATALILGRQDTLGVIVQRHGVIGSGLSSAMLDGIAEAAKRFNQRLELALVSQEEFMPHLQRLSTAAVDAVIVAGVYHPDSIELLVDMQKNGLPVVTIYGDSHHPNLPNIGCAESAIGQLTFKYLKSIGASQIAYIDSIPERTTGFLQASRSDETTHLISIGTHCLDKNSGEQAVAILQEQGVEFDAIATQSDTQALGVMRALLQSGRQIPEDVKVLGVDNSPICQAGLITLSSIDVKMKARGEKAVEIALAMRDSKSVDSIAFSPEIFARESTAGILDKSDRFQTE